VTAGANQAPVLAQPGDMTVNEGATADQIITATDGDGNPLTFSKVNGPTFLTVSTTSPGTGSAVGNIHLAPGFSDSGTYGATIRASDGSLNSDKSLAITVNNVNRAPTLNAISNMTVTEGATADQSISGSDPDGDPLTFTKVTGPTFVTITTSTPTTGNVHVAPLTGDAAGSPYTVQARASDGTDQDTKIFSVTVRPPNRAPVLAQPSDMTADEGSTADQAITATDPDGDALSFSKVSGPTFLTVSTTSPGTGSGTGNIHLAPGFSDSGTAGATVRASDGALFDDKSLTITVNNTNRAPTLNAITNMTVTEGATADQAITGSDPDGDALTFAKVTGPTFLTVSTTNPTTGNVHLAPVTGDAAGSPYSASASASDGALTDTKGFTITVNPVGQQNHAPVLAQPNGMTVDEGATADQVLTATDQDGDALSFTKVGGPTFLTVGTLTSTTGNAHLAPGFADAGTYGATVRASDATLSDEKSFQITVNNVNRAPVADAGGPYTGSVGIPVAFDGTGSSDPDGNALTYSWDFDATDGIGADATGPSPSHTYSATGTFTVTLTVPDDDAAPLSNTDTATATISESNVLPANAFIDAGDRVIRLRSAKPFWCLELEPANRSFRVTDIIPSSILATFNGTSIHSIGARRVIDDGRLEVCFAKDQLRILFASLSNGRRTVTVNITGDLNGGSTFLATLDVVVEKAGGPDGLATGDENAFAFASPNPLNPSTTISFVLSRPGPCSSTCTTSRGLVKTLANEFMGTGPHRSADGTRARERGWRRACTLYLKIPEPR
jgi:PKD repeat protein